MGDEPGDPRYEWVTAGDVGSFVLRLTAIREGQRSDGEPPRPAVAIRALHAFALRRKTTDLVECATHFEYDDAVTVLAIAALCRSVQDAADLAVRQWDIETAADTGTTPLTYGILHEVAGQRIALDVAGFVQEFRKAGKRELATKTLELFEQRRTNRDKAVLYMVLLDAGCHEEAVHLLRRSLATPRSDGSVPTHDTDPAEFHDLVGALYQLSPSERILEDWIDEELTSLGQRTPTVQLVAHLIISHRKGPDTLAEHVGRRLFRDALVPVCEKLFERSPQRCAMVRAHIPFYERQNELPAIIQRWHRSKVLGRTTKDLLTDIVTRGSLAEPLSLKDLEDLDTGLRDMEETDGECGLLWLVAAEHIDGRSGAELVTLLRKVEGRHDRYRAAQRIAEQLAVRVLAGHAEDKTRFIDYLTGLRDANESDAAYTARRELVDPTRPGPSIGTNAAVIAEIAARLYERGLAKDGWELLERCLENEQGLRPEDAAVVVARLRRSEMPDNNRYFLLLRATVGRWSDAHRREQAVRSLREQGFGAEADQVILSLW